MKRNRKSGCNQTHFLWCGALLASTIFSPSTQAQRTQTNFDADWRFHRGDLPGAEQSTLDDHSWRAVQLPHDWSIEDKDSPLNALPVLPLDASDWLFQSGDDAAWKAPAFDDSAWRIGAPPKSYEGLQDIPVGAFGWYRRRFQVPQALRGKEVALAFGKVDDVDETFVNGVRIGGSGSLPPNYATAYAISRRYSVPANLLKGDGSDVIAVRVYNGDGAGGLYVPPFVAVKSNGPFDTDAPGGGSNAFVTGGVGWYRKSFAAPTAWANRSVALNFDGVYQDATIWLNNRKIASHPYGYTAFNLDLTPFLKLGARNLLAVRVDTSGQHTRWYSGSGIYRHVSLTVTPALHCAPWGVSITTPQIDAASATVAVRARLQNDGALPAKAALRFSIRDRQGDIRSTSTGQLPVGAHSPGETAVILHVPQPLLWSPEAPNLYSLRMEVLSGGKTVDSLEVPFGIRSISFDAKNGFLLNGRAVKLRGGCVHHDNGPLGSAAYDRAEERRVALLKAAGFNAIRTSHNPPSTAFLEACDRLGMLVMDEAFDAWAHGKNPNDYNRFFKENWPSDIRSMIERDRNHPSVIIWSIGNEIPEQGTAEGTATARQLAALVRAIDPTRPVAAAYSAGYQTDRDSYLGALDIAGYNYKYGDYANDHAKFPDRVIAATESFPRDAFNYWMPVEDQPYVIGDFVWTALDYLGEAGIGRAYYPGEGNGFLGDYPYTVAGCGDLDLIGTRKPQSYYRGILWNVGPKVTAFVDAVAEGQPNYSVSGWGWPDERASWTWPGSEGKTRTVRVYARTPRVKLLLNGRDLGEQPTTRATRFTASYAVPYEAGL